jgi:hypothetical protein
MSHKYGHAKKNKRHKKEQEGETKGFSKFWDALKPVHLRGAGMSTSLNSFSI